MLRFALGAGGRASLRSPDGGSPSRVTEDGVRGAAAELADSGAVGSGIAGATGLGVLSVVAGDGCSAAPGAYTRAATEAKPNTSPAAAAATIVQRERTGRCDSGSFAVSDTLDTYGASLSGALLGGGNDSSTRGTDLAGGAHALLLTGVGIARNVIFSFAVGTADWGCGSSSGGGGGMLERKRGICSDCGASPPRTTTA
jgi:hypothetical protein